MALTVPTPEGARYRVYRNSAAEDCGASERVKLELPPEVQYLRVSNVTVKASGGTVTRMDPAIYDAESGGMRLWMAGWGAPTTPGLQGAWTRDGEIAPSPGAGGVWFAPHPDQGDGAVEYRVTLEVLQTRSTS